MYEASNFRDIYSYQTFMTFKGEKKFTMIMISNINDYCSTMQLLLSTNTQSHKLPVRTDTNDRQTATAFQRTVIATFQLQYPMPKISDPEMKMKQHIYVYVYTRIFIDQNQNLSEIPLTTKILLLKLFKVLNNNMKIPVDIQACYL